MRAWARRVLSLITVISLMGAAGLMRFAVQDDGVVLHDLDGRRVKLEAAPDGGDVTPTGGRFAVPAHGLDVPLLEISVEGRVLNPPTATDAFVLRDPDRVQAEGARPRIVAMHAVRDGRAPGNVFAQTVGNDVVVTAREGDELHVDGQVYEVTAVEVMLKGTASRSQDIWAPQEDGETRLVVITCLQRPGARGPAPENLVLHAARAA